jgi:hypothetical protein
MHILAKTINAGSEHKALKVKLNLKEHQNRDNWKIQKDRKMGVDKYHPLCQSPVQ